MIVNQFTFMGVDAFYHLVRLFFAGSAAIVVVLLLRPWLRRVFGCVMAYQAWATVPVALLAAALPSVTVAKSAALTVGPVLYAANKSAMAIVVVGFSWTFWVLGIWAAGALGTAAWLVHTHRAYVRQLGPLTERDGIHFASTSTEGPALLGLWRPKIVVPADFTSRYEPHEQSLIVAHERRHLARRDPLANGLAAVFLCAFWFNPLVHFALSRFRFDQELACDAAVMQIHSGQVKAYAAAMFKTQSGGAPALATCHWQSCHPLKERIMNLKKPAPAAGLRIAGQMIIATLLSLCAASAVVARADIARPPAVKYVVAMTLDSGGKVVAPRLRVGEGEQFKVRHEESAGDAMEGEFTVSASGDDAVMIRAKLRLGGEVVSEPRLLIKLGQTGGISFDGANGGKAYKLTMNVALAGKGKPGA